MVRALLDRLRQVVRRRVDDHGAEEERRVVIAHSEIRVDVQVRADLDENLIQLVAEHPWRLAGRLAVQRHAEVVIAVHCV